MTPRDFIRKWEANTRTERAASQSHFNDLCELLGVPKPLDVDPTGDSFTFEKGATMLTGGEGFADVWKKHCFAWEYKGKHADLGRAYAQLKRYTDALENPPLLIVSDMRTIIVHTAFTNAIKQAHTFSLTDLEDPSQRKALKHAFIDSEFFRPGLTRDAVTAEAATKFSKLAHALQQRGFEPRSVAHFLDRLIFCMFAEDVGILPNRIFSTMARASATHPGSFEQNAASLFKAMAEGGVAGFQTIDHFNGGLFDDDAVLPLEQEELKLLADAAALDWSNIEPSIFGTLFERGLDPDKRSQQGAHYTDADTIMRIVNPVVIRPWLDQWNVEKPVLQRLIGRAGKKIPKVAADRFNAFLERLRKFRVLDPACGSGNFLYVSLRALKNLEKRIIQEAEAIGFPPQFPGVGPEAVQCFEVNPYAAELARVSIWIGELQWRIENGFDYSRNPILKPLDQIECGDALLNDDGTEATWPQTSVIVGNPPFLGSRFFLRRLPEDYVKALRSCYADRVSGNADLVVYWFQKTTDLLLKGVISSFGLVGTKSIAKGVSRAPLEAIVSHDTAEITDAWTNELWTVEGADVRVAIVCASNSPANVRILNGSIVPGIDADLTAARSFGSLVDAVPLGENMNVAYQGVKLTGSFDLDGRVAREMLLATGNPNGRPNSDVIKRLWDINDVVGRPSDRWVIDFGTRMDRATAARYEKPFEYVLARLPQERATMREARTRERFWLFQRPRPKLRAKIDGLSRYIVTPESSEHRIFCWADKSTLPVGSLFAIARDDDVTFGILHSKIHETWATAQGNRLGVGNQRRYNVTVTFQTFPFPNRLTPDRNEDSYESDLGAERIAYAARTLDRLRTSWLNPDELVRRVPEVVPGYPDRLVPVTPEAEAQLKRRGLTKLYNERPTWLRDAHSNLDEAVASAYAWPWPMADEEILERLLSLNQERPRKAQESAKNA